MGGPSWAVMTRVMSAIGARVSSEVAGQALADELDQAEGHQGGPWRDRQFGVGDLVVAFEAAELGVGLTFEGLAQQQGVLANGLALEAEGAVGQLGEVDAVAGQLTVGVVAAVEVPPLDHGPQLGLEGPERGPLRVVDQRFLGGHDRFGDAGVGHRGGQLVGVIEADAPVGQRHVGVGELTQPPPGDHPALHRRRGHQGLAGHPPGGRMAVATVAHPSHVELGQHMGLGRVERGPGPLQLHRRLEQLVVGGTGEVGLRRPPAPLREIRCIEHAYETTRRSTRDATGLAEVSILFL